MPSEETWGVEFSFSKSSLITPSAKKPELKTPPAITYIQVQSHTGPRRQKTLQSSSGVPITVRQVRMWDNWVRMWSDSVSVTGILRECVVTVKLPYHIRSRWEENNIWSFTSGLNLWHRPVRNNDAEAKMLTKVEVGEERVLTQNGTSLWRRTENCYERGER